MSIENEAESSPEDGEDINLEPWPEKLGFAESPELLQLHTEYVQALKEESESLRGLGGIAHRYHMQAEAVVNQYKDEAFRRAQIGLMIRIACIQLEAGKLDRYRKELEDALRYADNEGFDDIVAALRKALP